MTCATQTQVFPIFTHLGGWWSLFSASEEACNGIDMNLLLI